MYLVSTWQGKSMWSWLRTEQSKDLKIVVPIYDFNKSLFVVFLRRKLKKKTFNDRCLIGITPWLLCDHAGKLSLLYH